MIFALVLLVLLQFSLMHATRNELDSNVDYQLSSLDCPPWFRSSVNSSGRCYCADTLKNIVECDGKKSYIALTNCMTFDIDTGMVLVGACPYSVVPQDTRGNWVPLPSNVSLLEEHLCSPLNRAGMLCGKCEKGYGISVHSTDFGCASCSSHPHGWAWFFFTGILLQAFFFLIIFSLQIRVTTPKLNGFLLVCQVMGLTYIDRAFPKYLTASGNAGFNRILRFEIIFSKLWVLEFFTTELPRACFKENIDMLRAVALQYVPAFAPFFFLFCAFILVRLVDCNYKPVSFVLKPYKKLNSKLSKYIDFNRSLLHTFSSIIVLTYSKLAFVSYSLLFPTRLYNASGVVVHSARWYHDAEIDLFGPRHLPYGILAIVILVFFVFTPPLFLVLYPLKRFRSLLHKLKLDYPGLDAFMDCFQGYYKDGTDNGRDLRYFSALYFVLRLLFIGTRLFTIYNLQWNLLVFSFVSSTIIFAFSRPYKKKIYNIIDVLFLSLLSLQSFLYSVYKSLTAHTRSSFPDALPAAVGNILVLVSIIPSLYFAVLIMLQVVASIKATKRVVKWPTDCIRKYILKRRKENTEFSLVDWPQRLLGEQQVQQSEYVKSYEDSVNSILY